MADASFSFASNADGLPIAGYRWYAPAPRAAVVIAHGAAEHALRYDRFARALNAAAYEVWAVDHRGHGASQGPEGLGDCGSGGWGGLVGDLGQCVALAHEAHRDLPLVLFAHSMGSLAAQDWVPEHSREIDALIMSGSGSTPRDAAPAGPPASNPNAAVPGARTPFDWLSRDPDEVDRYIADPLCGFDMSFMRRPGQRVDRQALYDPERLRAIRPDLPVLLLAGDEDPVNQRLEGLHRLETYWREAGVRRIDRHYYPGGRHEMLNETNRDEVTANLIAWLGEALERTRSEP